MDKEDIIKRIEYLENLHKLVKENRSKIMNFACYNTYETYTNNLACEIDVLRVLIGDNSKGRFS